MVSPMDGHLNTSLISCLGLAIFSSQPLHLFLPEQNTPLQKSPCLGSCSLQLHPFCHSFRQIKHIWGFLSLIIQAAFPELQFSSRPTLLQMSRLNSCMPRGSCCTTRTGPCPQDSHVIDAQASTVTSIAPPGWAEHQKRKESCPGNPPPHRREGKRCT